MELPFVTGQGFFARKTQKVRHFIVKLVAPKLYSEHKEVIGLPRPMIQFVKANVLRGNPLTGVEIGVEGGINAETILETLPIRKLYLVDPYLPYKLTDGRLRDETGLFVIAQKNLSRFKGKIKFIKKKSSEAVDAIPDGVDFVYIDGDHCYEAVKTDISMYYPKVRSGGVLGGHDFSVYFLGVCRAVTEFADANDLKIFGDKVDWWFVK